MIAKTALKEILVSLHTDVERCQIVPRALPDDGFPRRVFVGVRRAGKSYMLFQMMQQRLAAGSGWDEMLYLNFEDDRLAAFTAADFDLILSCHAELYARRPMLFLDEVQVVEGWERYARRLADTGYSVWLTGSNARMLSSEIMGALGGRYLCTEVYPYSFAEMLRVQAVRSDTVALLGAETRATVVRAWQEYLCWGGLPETVGLAVKRPYISSTFLKIYLNDIALRNKLANPHLLRLLVQKLAENVCQPVSYNRLTHVLSSVGGKITTPTVVRYIDSAEAAWLLLRLRNVSAPFAEKESLCKYYFVDNGVLNLFLLNGAPALLENVVALALFRRYGHDADNERVFFYNDRVEVDFYVPEDQLAIQVSYSVAQSDETAARELGALSALPKALPCRRRLLLTDDEEREEHDQYGHIEVLPVWKWLTQEGGTA